MRFSSPLAYAIHLLTGPSIACCFALFCTPQPAHAQDPTPPPLSFPHHHLTLAPLLGLSLQPTEWDLHNTPDAGSTPGPLLGIFGVRASAILYTRFGVDLETTYIPFLSAQDVLNHTLSYRLGTSLNIFSWRRFAPFISLGAGAYHCFAGDHAYDVDPRLDYGLGVRFLASKPLLFRADVRSVITDGVGAFEVAQNIEVLAALEVTLWSYSAPHNLDWDKDNVPNTRDMCPRTPGRVQGCPDADGDGLRDLQDRCPAEAGPLSRRGCPVYDRDGDQVEDIDDLCPDSPGPPTLQGCPDTDQDGLRDLDDRCPEQAGSRDTKGCPDTDDDGLVDIDDLCPQDPGPRDTKGCPKGSAVILRGIRFSFASAKLLPEALPTLDSVGTTLQQYPKLRVRIDGHTDDVGSDRDNINLSRSRAKAVRTYLIRTYDIDPKRLTTQGFGKTQPLISGTTDEERAKNRRIEFTILESNP